MLDFSFKWIFYFKGVCRLEFKYRVRDKRGSIYTGNIDTENRAAVIDSLLQQNYYILELEEVKGSRSLELHFFRPVRPHDLVIMTRQLLSMVSAGLPILQVFTVLKEQTRNPVLKDAMDEISSDIEAGSTLADALEKYPRIFSPIYTNMVRAGETGGILDSVLERLAAHIDREREIDARIMAASIYPSIIICFTIIVVIFIIAFVMPTFIGMFEQNGATLPVPTRILVALSAFLRTSVLYIIIALLIITYLLKKWGQTEKGRYCFDHMYLKIPIIGKINSQVVEARFARTMGTLIATGIPVLQALEVVEGVIGNAYITKAISQARSNISEGETITIPLKASGVFEPMVTHMIAVGEETGTLDEMLLKLSEYFDREVLHTVEQAMAAVEPILILAVALLIGGVVIATLLPIFELSGTIM